MENAGHGEQGMGRMAYVDQISEDIFNSPPQMKNSGGRRAGGVIWLCKRNGHWCNH